MLSKADVMQATGDAIAAFAEMQCLTPRYCMVSSPIVYDSSLQRSIYHQSVPNIRVGSW